MKRQRLFIFAVCRLAAVLLAAGLVASCVSAPGPTAEEIKERDYWGSRILPEQRQRIDEDAHRHTDWSEKKQILFELESYHKLLLDSQRTHRASTSKPVPPPLPY